MKVFVKNKVDKDSGMAILTKFQAKWITFGCTNLKVSTLELVHPEVESQIIESYLADVSWPITPIAN